MKHLTLALVANVAISPYAYATPEANDLRQTNLANTAINVNQTQDATSAPDALATNPINTLNLGSAHRDDLDVTATINETSPAALDETLPQINLIHTVRLFLVLSICSNIWKTNRISLKNLLLILEVIKYSFKFLDSYFVSPNFISQRLNF
ncbi:MAG: hypothetical protein AAF215_25165 [Cyanobacteria bacterium P01_A01_bin.123]